MGRKHNTRNGTSDLVVTSVRIERETWQRFCEIAERNHRSASQEFRHVVDAHVAAHADGERGKAKDRRTA